MQAPSSTTPLGIRLVVFSRRSHASTVFHGPQEPRKNIYLYYNDAKKHVNVVLFRAAFNDRSYFCHLCLKAYSNFEQNRCQMTCFRCQERDRPACVGQLQCCDDCKRWFAGDGCFQQHLRLNTCNRTRYCSDCKAYLADPTKIATHVCGCK